MLVFYLDDTLYDQLIPFQKAYEDQFHMKDINVEELYRLSRKYGDEVFVASETGKMSMQAMHRYRIQKAFFALGQTITDAQADQFQANYRNYQQQITLNPFMEEILDYCVKHQIEIALLTNGASNYQRNKIKQLQLERWFLPNRIFVSGEVGMMKPDPEIFSHVARQVDKLPEELCLIGDSLENDILGAINAGWDAVWLNKYHISATHQVEPKTICHTSKEVLDWVKHQSDIDASKVNLGELEI